MIDLGTRVRDVVTGFRGIATARIENLFGPPEIQITPEDLKEDGTLKEKYWFTETAVEAVGEYRLTPRPQRET